MATSISFVACASNGTTDELAGETSADDAVDGKADGAVDGSYTYYEVSTAPIEGGFFLHRLNRKATICRDGTSSASCFAPELDWSEAKLTPELQRELLDAAAKDASGNGVMAIVRGRFAPQTQQGEADLGRFIVTEAWVAESESPSSGVFVRADFNGVRCITWPCPIYSEKALNTSRWANIHAIDWSAGGFDRDQIMKLEDEMAARPWGLLIAGDRYTYKANNQTATGRTATAVYHRLTDDRCFVTGCSGEICSDLQDVNSTCEWKPEYACYASATCERQPDGLCGWTETPELTACLEAAH